MHEINKTRKMYPECHCHSKKKGIETDKGKKIIQAYHVVGDQWFQMW